MCARRATWTWGFCPSLCSWCAVEPMEPSRCGFVPSKRWGSHRCSPPILYPAVWHRSRCDLGFPAKKFGSGTRSLPCSRNPSAAPRVGEWAERPSRAVRAGAATPWVARAALVAARHRALLVVRCPLGRVLKGAWFYECFHWCCLFQKNDSFSRGSRCC